ncbi:sulfotransferase family protein [Limisalsivibrio acetivorans]|uniref:sulfotransferase family protein n=1 Tax=Limisalsivibrio acetivorans TaxID=1304888 RepID=UPI0003B76630|nr:sulfotransferase [Limisalsivibrio acetivorans]
MNEILRRIYNKTIYKSSPLISLIEKKLLDNYGHSAQYPQIFIIGSPRTGSTFLYQLLTSSYNVSYIDNFSASFHKNILIGLHLSNLFFNDRPHSGFNSEYGKTVEGGPRGPNECGDFWYNWLTEKQHVADESTLNSEEIGKLNVYLNSMSNMFSRPFIFKNLNAGLRLRMLKISAEYPKFIFIRRNIYDTVLSILKGRDKVMGSQYEWFSLKPEGYESLLTKEPLEQVTAQVALIEKRIINDLKLYCDTQYITIFYEDLLDNPIKVLEKIEDFTGIKQREGLVMPKPVDGRKDLSNDFKNKVDYYLEKYR